MFEPGGHADDAADGDQQPQRGDADQDDLAARSWPPVVRWRDDHRQEHQHHRGQQLEAQRRLVQVLEERVAELVGVGEPRRLQRPGLEDDADHLQGHQRH